MLRIVVDDWKRQAAGFKEIGQGGEAVIYKMRNDVVGKIYLQPNDPQFKQNPKQSKQLQDAARVRIEEMQRKIFEFPSGLPSGFVVPTGALIDGKRRVFGYVMPFIEGLGLDKLARTDANLTNEQVVQIISSLHKLVLEIHQAGVIIGDFNENNIIVDSNFVPHIVDTDSCQFGPYLCRNFIPQFVAPELVGLKVPAEVLSSESVQDVDAGSSKTRRRKKSVVKKSGGSKSPESLILLTPHTELTDWYSFLVIVMRLITSTGPYGGVLGDMEIQQRLIERATVFDPRVIYPGNVLPLEDVPRPILELFYRFFHRNERFIPNVEVFNSLKLSKPVRVGKRQKKGRQ